MTLHGAFEKVFVLSLPGAEERRAALEERARRRSAACSMCRKNGTSCAMRVCLALVTDMNVQRRRRGGGAGSGSEGSGSVGSGPTGDGSGDIGGSGSQ